MLVKMMYLKSLAVPHNIRENKKQIFSSYIEIQTPRRLLQII